ncbi:universal stress protein [Nonomuraea roseoviolacea subsp. roseoviolacea]|uniref:universal stress protein n=1 Tax=Nonomuraea roseoviolacea TaxID=103837 RepID=UPI0031D42A8D
MDAGQEDIVLVVGVDGSDAGLAAVAWAMQEAVIRRATVRVVHVMPSFELDGHRRESARTVVADALRRARLEQENVEVDAQLLTGDPRLGLIRASKDAELLVVGSHGLGGLWELAVGSVALGVPGQATCPVAVIRTLPVQPRNEIVVGVDGSEGGRAAIEFAFTEAALRGGEVHAVHAVSHAAGGRGPEAGPDSDIAAGAEQCLMTEALAGFSKRYPDVKFVERLELGRPAEVLREVSAGAGLLVVGSRGRGPVAGYFLGSVSNALLQHAPCPLVVVAVADTS